MTPIGTTLAAFAIGALLSPSPVAPSTPANVGWRIEPRGVRTLMGPAYGSYAWPVQGPVIRGFEPPPDPYGSGHRGIDIGAPFGSDMAAAQDGTVAFAGWVGGSLFISIDHADGVRSTYSWLSAISVNSGDRVVRGQSIGSTGQGHPGSSTPHLHFGALVGTAYIDPMLLLQPGEVAGIIHLAPLWGVGTWTTPELGFKPP
jgi:murein DD-endopeptidase MepM/ murein hydrolase activator NlpD